MPPQPLWRPICLAPTDPLLRDDYDRELYIALLRERYAGPTLWEIERESQANERREHVARVLRGK